jgi:hypothetical protein
MSPEIDLSLAQIILLLFLGLVTIIVTAANSRSLLVIPALLIFLATIGLALDFFDRPIPTWLLPIQTRRSDLVLALGIIFSVNILFRAQHLELKYLSRQALLILAINLYASLVRGVHEGMLSSLQSVLFALAVSGSVVFGSTLILSLFHSPQMLLRAIPLANAIWLISILIQLFISPFSLVASNYRLLGLTPNPQAAALTLATFIISSLWFLIHAQTKKHKQYMLLMLGLNCLLVLWTGSRTGAIMSVAGGSIVLYRNAGRAILWIPLIAALLFIFVQISLSITGVSDSFQRVLSTENTRSSVLPMLLQSFLNNPLFGAGVQDAGASENSYILGLAAYGLGMGMLIFALLAVSIYKCKRLWSIGKDTRHPLAKYADLIVAYQFMYFLGALAEGYIIARVSPLLFQMILFSVLGTYVLKEYTPSEEIVNK